MKNNDILCLRVEKYFYVYTSHKITAKVCRTMTNAIMTEMTLKNIILIQKYDIINVQQLTRERKLTVERKQQ